MSFTPAEKLVQFIDNFIDYCYNNIETMYGIEHNNEHEPIIIPSSFYGKGIGNISCMVASNFNTYWWGYGGWSLLYEYDIACLGGELTLSGWNRLGRYKKNTWDSIIPFSGDTPNPDEGDSLLSNYISSHDMPHIVKKTYPDLPISPNYYINAYNNPAVNFDQNNGAWTGAGLFNTYQTYNGYSEIPYPNIKYGDYSLTYSADEVYVDTTQAVTNCYDATMCVSYKDAVMVTRTNDTSYINKYITDNDAEYNYTYTYETENGDEITVYYGDNYVIYKCDDNTQITYDDNYNIINKIKDDTDLPVENPTYHDKKYGPEPPPPPPPVSDDDYIDMGLGVETDGMAMYNMAVLTRDDLIQLIGDFETNSDTGLSFLPHVLGLYKLGIESSQLLTTNLDKIKLHKEPGKTAFISNDNYNIVDEQLQVIDCGSITVDREELLTNTYLDFSPYTTYEMFIPGCGWITLPDTVVGRTISVHIVFDLTTCSCKGVVRSEGELLGGSGSTLATVNGIIGSSVPLSINETGLQRGAIMSGAVQTVTALGTSAMGIGLGNPYMGMSGIAMAAGSLAETHIAGNATYTSTKGGATDYSVFGDGYKAVLKITRPKLEIPDNYGHTVGYVVNKYDSLSNYSGFTVCLNPHITGLTCTSDEKDEIARLLERGVILPSGE